MPKVLGDKRPGGSRADVVPWVYLVAFLVGTVIGKLGFLAPLPFVIAPVGLALWGGLSVVGALVATLGPAQRATSMTVRDALVEL